MIPDRFPKDLREYVTRFKVDPVCNLVFKLLIQMWQRGFNASKTIKHWKTTLAFLHDTGVHLHTDLIIGLPGEDIASFGEGFDRLI